MSWLLITVIAYFLNAVSLLVDKFLLVKKIENPVVYTFYVSVLSGLVIFLWPFGFVWPSASNIWLAGLSGVSFMGAMFYMFKALNRGEASRIGPLIGGLSPIFVMLFSFWWLGNHWVRSELIGVAFLIVGSLVLSVNHSQGLKFHIAPVIVAAMLFAFSFVLAKDVYTQVNFITGLILMRFFTAIGGLFLLLPRGNFAAIMRNKLLSVPATSGIFIFGQSAGALSAILVNYAISLANVTVINALQGLQYVFLLVLALILYRLFPHLKAEELRGRALLFKIVAIIFISIGLVFIV